MIAVIVGATGLVGRTLLLKLINDSSIEHIISIGRRSSNLNSSKIKEILVSDLTGIKDHLQELKGDLYYCCLGTTIKDAGSKTNFEKIDLHAVVDFAEIASAHQAKCLTMISATGANTNAWTFYSQVKGKAESRIKSLQLRRLVIFQPGLLIGDRVNKRPLEEVAIRFYKLIAPAMGTDIRKKIATEIDHLADRMLIESQKTNPGIFIIHALNI